MALGTLSSLGLGSKVLNHDVLDKLRKADEASLIDPIDKKIEKNVEKQTELVAITSTLRELKSSTNKLGDYSTYLGRSSQVIGDALKATISAGVPTQDIKIDVDSVATSDINEIGSKYESRESIFSQKDSVLKFHHKGKDYTIDIKAGMELGEVAQLITDTTNGEVMGIVMKTGGSNPYQLMINSKDTGESSRIYFGSTISGSVVPSGAFELKDGDLSITLKDK
ncbi:flagellar cap protein FliD N-terminal domain-containing protein, partial [uncultured Helicobacter sp.]